MPLFVTKSDSTKPSNEDLKNNGFPIVFADDGNHIWISNNGSKDTDVKTFHTEKLSANGTVDGTHTPASGFTINASKSSTSTIVTGLTVNDHNITVETGTLAFKQETPISVLNTPISDDSQTPAHDETFNIITGITMGGTNKHELTLQTSTVKIPDHSSHTLSSPAYKETVELSSNNASGIVTFVEGTNITIDGTRINEIAIAHKDPTENTGYKLSAASNDDATRGTTSVITAIKRDNQGHVTGIDSIRLPASDNTDNHMATHEFSTLNHGVLTNSIVVSLSNCGPTGAGTGGPKNTNGFTIMGSGDVTVTQNDRLVTINCNDQHVTAVDNHYVPLNGAVTTTGAGPAVGWSGSVITSITRDAAGHITKVTKGTIPANPNTNTHVKKHKFTYSVSNSNTLDIATVSLSNIDDLNNSTSFKLSSNPNNGISLSETNNGINILSTLEADQNIKLEGKNGMLYISAKDTHVANHSFSFDEEGSNGYWVVVKLSNTDSSGSSSTSFQVLAGDNVTVNETTDGFILSSEDTKDTCGADPSSSKLFLVGRTAQNTGVSYSNVNCYIDTDSYLYSNGAKVLTSHQKHGLSLSSGILSINDTNTNTQNVVGWSTAFASNETGATSQGSCHTIKVVNKLPNNPNSNTLYLIV